MDVSLPHIDQAPAEGSDKGIVRPMIPTSDEQKEFAVPWAMQMRAISLQEPSRLVQALTGAILGCGGWVLSRGANDSGGVNLLLVRAPDLRGYVYGADRFRDRAQPKRAYSLN